MDRGPAALFGAIVAVGLGPAMWLGVRLGSVEVSPSKPPSVVGERTSGPDQLVGGAGAGESPLDEPAVNATPRGQVLPMTSSASPTPADTSTSPSGATSATSSADTTTEPQTTPPTESTTVPATEPTDGTTDPTEATDPPTGDDGGTDQTDPGAGLAESGDTGGIAAGSAMG